MAVLTWFFSLLWPQWIGLQVGILPRGWLGHCACREEPLVWATVGDRMAMDKLSDGHGRVHGSLWDLVQLQPPLRVSVSPTVECVQYLDYLTGWRDAEQVISWLSE